MLNLGKFVLAVTAIMLLQIGFGIYIGSKGEIAVNVVPVYFSDLHRDRTLLDDLSSPVFEEEIAETIVPIVRIRSEGRRHVMHVRSVNIRAPRPEAIQSSVQREYFGNMLVERTFGLVAFRDRDHQKPGKTRQVFGRTMVERSVAGTGRRRMQHAPA